MLRIASLASVTLAAPLALLACTAPVTIAQDHGAGGAGTSTSSSGSSTSTSSSSTSSSGGGNACTAGGGTCLPNIGAACLGALGDPSRVPVRRRGCCLLSPAAMAAGLHRYAMHDRGRHALHRGGSRDLRGRSEHELRAAVDEPDALRRGLQQRRHELPRRCGHVQELRRLRLRLRLRQRRVRVPRWRPPDMQLGQRLRSGLLRHSLRRRGLCTSGLHARRGPDV